MLLMLAGTYCGSNKPYIQDISLTFYLKNDTLLDAIVKLPLDKITCKKQIYEMTDTGQLLISDNCIERQLDKHHVDLEGVFYNDINNDITLKTNVGDMTLDLCKNK